MTQDTNQRKAETMSKRKAQSRSYEIPSTTPKAAKAEAIKASKRNPGWYVTVDEVFGMLYVGIHKRLNVFDPGSGHPCLDFYVLGGKVKQFTEKQIIACQNATPTMS